MDGERDPAAGQGRGGRPAEEFLEFDGEHRALGGVVHPDPRAGRDGDPLGGQLVQPAGLAGGPGQQALQRRADVEALQVGAPPGPGEFRFQPVVGCREQGLVADVRPGRAERLVQEGQPRAQRARALRPAQQFADALAGQAVQQRGPHQRRVGAGELGGVQFERAQRGEPTGRQFAAPAAGWHGPVHLVAFGEQVRGGAARGALVDRHRPLDACRGGAGGPVGDRDGQPGCAAQRRSRRGLGGGAGGHQEGAAAGPGHPLGVGQRDQQAGGGRVRQLAVACGHLGPQAPDLLPPAGRVRRACVPHRTPHR